MLRVSCRSCAVIGTSARPYSNGDRKGEVRLQSGDWQEDLGILFQRLVAETMRSFQRDEGDSTQFSLLRFALGLLFDRDQFLGKESASNRSKHGAANPKLVYEMVRNLRRCGGEQDPIVRCAVRIT